MVDGGERTIEQIIELKPGGLFLVSSRNMMAMCRITLRLKRIGPRAILTLDDFMGRALFKDFTYPDFDLDHHVKDGPRDFYSFSNGAEVLSFLYDKVPTARYFGGVRPVTPVRPPSSGSPFRRR